MPSNYSYPGVYIEEIPSGVRTITGVSTSNTAFVDYFKTGPINEPQTITSLGDFERVFGGLDIQSESSYAIQQYYLNGGSIAFVVRVTANAKPARLNLFSSSYGYYGYDGYYGYGYNGSKSGVKVLEVEAKSAGKWGNNLQIAIDHNTRRPADLNPPKKFNLVIREVIKENDKLQILRTQVYRNLSMTKDDPLYCQNVINEDPISLIRLKVTGISLPAHAGYIFKITDDALDQLLNIDKLPGSICNLLQTIKNTEFRNIVDFLNRIKALIGEEDTNAYKTPILNRSSLNRDVINESREDDFLQLGQGGDDFAGADGSEPNSPNWFNGDGASAIIEGMKQLDKIVPQIFNILCLPGISKLDIPSRDRVNDEAIKYCESKRAFYIVDIPEDTKTLDQIKKWMENNDSRRHKNAAVYFPRLLMSDPLNKNRPRNVASSGTIAGIYAKTDSTRGVWKAPAGIDNRLLGAKLTDKFTDLENGQLNPLGINVLRTFPVFGSVNWGARTLEGADQMASEWKYIPVRRTALFIEESLYQGTKWIVFEPNDEPLWAQIRLNVGAFMHTLFRQGAFQGINPKDAYLVKCDKETTTQTDINQGIVNILVGFAPLKPAEFVIIKIQQMAGQIQS